VNGAASLQLVVLHRWGTRLGVWCEWSCLSAAGGAPAVGYTRLGVWSRPPTQADTLARGEAGHDVAFPLLPLGVHPDCRDHNAPAQEASIADAILKARSQFHARVDSISQQTAAGKAQQQADEEAAEAKAAEAEAAAAAAVKPTRNHKSPKGTLGVRYVSFAPWVE
jgi:hypothetical protein